MKVVHGIDALERSSGRIFVVVGVFDGLHLGHEYLLRELGHAATARDATPAVITFDHHPDEVITGVAPPLLCDPAERLDRLAAAGVGLTIVQTFDVALRMTPYDAFVRRIVERVDLAGFLMTPESAFGHDRGGTAESVAELGRVLGYDVVVVPPLLVDDRPVSSGEIRRAIAGGRLRDAEWLLGRPYSVIGAPVVGGPDAELEFAIPVALPPSGEYRVDIDGDGPATAIIDPRGGLVLRRRSSTAEPIRVTFRSDGLPDQALAATIRRS